MPQEINIPFTFFGTSEFSVYILETLEQHGLKPIHIVTMPDKPKGRGLTLTPPPVKIWAEKRNIPISQPEILNNQKFPGEVFIVASYGKIIPKEIIELPARKTLNVHPSLLPKLRGPSPIQTAILKEEKTGVTIMRLDEKMDHGPIIAQKEIPVEPWPTSYETLEKILGAEGGNLLAKILPDWMEQKIKEVEQDHSAATFTKILEKSDGLIDLKDSPRENIRKILAFHQWPGTYFFTKDKTGEELRVKIKKAKLEENGELLIERVTPEGRGEMDYRHFLSFLNGV